MIQIRTASLSQPNNLSQTRAHFLLKLMQQRKSNILNHIKALLHNYFGPNFFVLYRNTPKK